MMTSLSQKLSPFLWLVTEVPTGVWIRGKFKLKIDRSKQQIHNYYYYYRSVKTRWQEYGVIVRS